MTGYEFHRVTSRLVTFCGADLSSFYLDVIKDRLYCDPEHFAVAPEQLKPSCIIWWMRFLRLLAPHSFSFTTDESWQFRRPFGSYFVSGYARCK